MAATGCHIEVLTLAKRGRWRANCSAAGSFGCSATVGAMWVGKQCRGTFRFRVSDEPTMLVECNPPLVGCKPCGRRQYTCHVPRDQHPQCSMLDHLSPLNASLLPVAATSRSERYSTIVRCGLHGELLFSRRTGNIGAQWSNAWNTVVRQRDAQTGGFGAPLSTPALSTKQQMSHNAAFLCTGPGGLRLVSFGGRHRKGFQTEQNGFASERGIRRIEVNLPATSPMQHHERWMQKWEEDAEEGSTYSSSSNLIRGNHTGCVERRVGFSGICEFDGRLAAVSMDDGREILYARANTRTFGGGRHVHVTWRRRGTTEAWAPFRLVTFACGEPVEERMEEKRRGVRRNGNDLNGVRFVAANWTLRDIYFFQVQRLGQRARTLSALFPAIYVLDEERHNASALRGGVFICWSADGGRGLHWTQPRLLMSSPVVMYGRGLGRIRDFPVDLTAMPSGDLRVTLEHEIELSEELGHLAEAERMQKPRPHHCVYTLRAHALRPPPPETSDAGRNSNTAHLEQCSRALSLSLSRVPGTVK